ncbi:hypothetical protein ACYOEI_14815, partial [Singulisphaera rosea]
STTWVTLAAMTGAAVVPASCRMNEDGTFQLDFLDAFHVPPDARREGRATEWVERALKELEDQVRRHPEQSNDYFFWQSEAEHGKRLPAIKAPHEPRRQRSTFVNEKGS